MIKLTFQFLSVLLFVMAGNITKMNHTPSNSIIKTLQLDTESSIIHWKGTKISGKHEGDVHFKEGSIVIANGTITSGYLEVEMNTIGVTDIPAHEVKPRKNLTNHLKSDDFFYTKKYPIATFIIKETGSLMEENLKIRGDLTIRDVTKEIIIDAKKLPFENDELVFETSFVINRFDWNVAYQGSIWENPASVLSDNLVRPNIELRLKLYFH